LVDTEIASSATAKVFRSDQATLRTPVFIVGSPRSGTSILTSALLAAGYNGYREGNFLTLLQVLNTALDRHRDIYGQGKGPVLAIEMNWPGLKNDIFAVLKRHVDALNPVSPWVDKTGNPEMIEAVPQILHMWPTAVFIFAKRRAIENIVSRLQKFPGHSFEYHCRDWARNMAAWRTARETPGLQAIEIDQQEIVRAPSLVAADLARFLGTNPEQREKIRRTFATDRPQQTDSGSAARVLSLDSVGWTAQQQDTFRRLCGPELEQFQYSTTQSYWTLPPS